MLSFERQQQILELLNLHKCVTVDFLCKQLFASSATIRRDLAEMAEKNLIIRVHGGAALLEGANQDLPLLVRVNKHRDKKEAIAKLALRYIADSSAIFMDSSSTVTFLAEKLGNFRDLSVLTNGIHTMNTLNEQKNTKIFFCGGLIKDDSSVTGASAIDFIGCFHADLFFFSCCGLFFLLRPFPVRRYHRGQRRKRRCQKADVRPRPQTDFAMRQYQIWTGIFLQGLPCFQH